MVNAAVLRVENNNRGRSGAGADNDVVETIAVDIAGGNINTAGIVSAERKEALQDT